MQRSSVQETKKALAPIEIAREALRRLASRRVAPTPDNYRQLYHEIAGHAPEAAETGAEQMLLKLAAELPRGPDQADTLGVQIEQAVAAHNWDVCKAVLIGLAEQQTPPPAPPAPWGQLVKDLIKHWESRHGRFTIAKKREGLERVLKKFASDPAVLPVKLQALIESWTESPAAAQDHLIEPVESSATPAEDLSTPGRNHDSPTARLRQLIAQILEATASTQLGQQPHLAEESRALAHQARMADDGEGTAQFATRLKEFLLKLERAAEDAPALQQGLVRLLQLLVKNMRELVVEDPWLEGQVAAVEKLVANPLDARLIEDAERCLKDLVLKQGVLKHGLVEIKNTLKNMVSRFIDRLGELSASTGDYHDKISGYAEQISRTEDVTELNRLLDEVMRETKLIQISTQSSRDELIAARREVEAAQAKIRQLESDLVHASEKVREDHLTGALNRRGLDIGFEREAARADRHGFPLCVALLDVDNFKQLNDKHGHQAGDDALVYLTQTIKDTVRPDDVVARYGGEEFLILLPDTGQDEAMAVIVRLQRALTRQLFLHNNERVLITFSAGIAQRVAGESKETLIGRADKALYRAKDSGKNRVVAAT